MQISMQILITYFFLVILSCGNKPVNYYQELLNETCFQFQKEFTPDNLTLAEFSQDITSRFASQSGILNFVQSLYVLSPNQQQWQKKKDVLKTDIQKLYNYFHATDYKYGDPSNAFAKVKAGVLKFIRQYLKEINDDSIKVREDFQQRLKNAGINPQMTKPELESQLQQVLIQTHGEAITCLNTIHMHYPEPFNKLWQDIQEYLPLGFN